MKPISNNLEGEIIAIIPNVTMGFFRIPI